MATTQNTLTETDATQLRIGDNMPSASRPIIQPLPQDSPIKLLQNRFPKVNLDLYSRYPLRRGRVGYCVIINEKYFDPITGQNTRDGTDRDAESLSTTFSKIGFTVDRHDNVNFAQLSQILKKCKNC